MITRLRRLLQRHRFARFIAASALNTLFGFTVYSAVILMHGPVWAALAASNLAGICFNFVTTGGYVFRSLVMARFPRFASVYAVVYLSNWFFIGRLSDLTAGPIVAQAILTPPMALLSYFLLKKLVFAGVPAGEPPARS
ncbi:GtrA family protein [Ramlibacter humi]|uniref:GtrA/DPMS transmembrane domain-containing protein n=1 Tax=Ramlibacter humi TaxID=2530451 RepID=A0A4Z0BVE9_9BURK|nr:GtrA family protein [Ramlibacter humi]TFZ01979.1 hypothetical protein EZ216_12425 [Ramlibacter humi]